MAEQPAPQPRRFNVEIPADLAATYANFAIITHSPWELFLDFAQILPNVPKARVRARIVLTPANAKMLLRALQENRALRGAARRDRAAGARPARGRPLFNAIRSDDQGGETRLKDARRWRSRPVDALLEDIRQLFEAKRRPRRRDHAVARGVGPLRQAIRAVHRHEVEHGARADGDGAQAAEEMRRASRTTRTYHSGYKQDALKRCRGVRDLRAGARERSPRRSRSTWSRPLPQWAGEAASELRACFSTSSQGIPTRRCGCSRRWTDLRRADLVSFFTTRSPRAAAAMDQCAACWSARGRPDQTACATAPAKRPRRVRGAHGAGRERSAGLRDEMDGGGEDAG